MAAQHPKHAEHHHEGLLTKLAKELVVAYDWLSGPAMSEHDRLSREIAETRPYRNPHYIM